jgi:hypothetical protein
MTVPSGTFQTFTAVGQREDLTDVIYNISPTETPILSSLARTKATAVYHEWQTDTLAAATTNNAQVEGDDATAATISPTTRLGNYTQIVAKTIQVSGTMMAVDLAGRRAEKAYQLSKASQELKRDQETIISANQGRSAGNSSTARKMGSLLSWLKTNSNYNTTDGANPTTIGVSTRSDGTTRTFTEAILKDGVQQVYTSGGSPKILVVGPALKQTVSAFAGIAAQRYMAPDNAPTTIIGAADVYLSDFGSISVVPDRFVRSRDAFILDPEYAAIGYLRPFQTNELAKTGDSEKTQILAEFTMEMRNEAAHGILADLKTA